MLIGGCGGPNMVFSDVWLLSTTEPVWKWQEIPVKNPQWAASHMWCHPACKVSFHSNLSLTYPFYYSFFTFCIVSGVIKVLFCCRWESR